MIEIRHRLTGVVLHTVQADTLSNANLRGANLSNAHLRYAHLRYADLTGANLTGANLTGANLTGANLTGANLSGANLSGANLSGANLSGANLSGADLTGANLSGADLYGANLRDANLRDAKYDGAPVVADLDAKIYDAVTSGGGSLNMAAWHTCETTHCRAGWAITLAGEAGKALEGKIGSCAAGALIYLASTGKIPNFFATDTAALEDIKKCAGIK